MHEAIHTPSAPPAIGPYSQAIRTERLVFTSGQVAIDPRTGALINGDIQAQARQVMENLRSVLQAAGTDFSQVVKSTVFLADIKDFAAFNEVYATYFTAAPPARSAFQVAALPLAARVEIEMIAMLP